ncbi:restriction endonuclease subunit S [Criibacterium bergeronii]|uniref:Restriction endonuclease subunit S n=1 Tax=Criibacterium bergeronii TaxID=1871336 RepID=A0A552VCT5_9FIRM|nr:restriction endonuclease subunit S [Criibacterium bergeronii]TRW28283.1 restriction endonuclease subunit S [Criibacterium bergeronii]
MIDTKALREKVLDLAIRGKLVPQDPNDEPASVLLKKIREQKKQMVKDGKLKAKDIKNDTIIFKGDDNLHYEQFADATVKCIEDEIPFELPAGWVWARLSMVGTTNIGLTYKPTDISDRGTIVLRSCNIKNGKIDLDDLVRVNTPIKENQYIENNDILICARNGSRALVGKCALLEDIQEKTSFGAFMAVFRTECYRYLYYYFNTSFFRSFFDSDDSKQINQVTQATLRDSLIPLPPFSEQVRITEKLETTIEVLDLINERVEATSEIISHIKSKILDLAIQGKLVPQNPDDEPASVLLDRIRAEKEELIKAGKIKRDKKESVIFKGEDNSYYEQYVDNTIKCIDDIIPFEIPDSWRWTRIISCSEEIFAGGDKPKNYSKTQTEQLQYPIYSNGVENNGLYGYTDIPRVIKPSVTVSGRGTIGFSCVRDKPFSPIIRLITITPSQLISVKFLNFIFKHLMESGTGSSILQLTVPMVKPKLIPLPPLAEQKRIVEAIETIFTQIDEISNAIA